MGVDSHPVRAIPSLWRPLRIPAFRNLLIADIASDVGAFMQSVGAAWMMVSLHAGPLYVALTQTASALPFFVLALPAGAIGDIVDRRKLILFTEVWMAAVAIVLTGITFAGKLSPLLLLIFGWWWADPVAGLAMVPIIANEGRHALRGETCPDCSH